MSLFAIGDTHLSFSSDKPMDIFKGWDNYVEKLRSNWNAVISPDDTVVIAGDISWAMNFEQAIEDFRFLNALPGNKIILKGNHDYWWNTMTKMQKFLDNNEFHTIQILHNNTYVVGNFGICGTRGWFFDAEKESDNKVLLREAGRLKTSISAAKELGVEPIVFLHYPPLNETLVCKEIYDVLLEENIKRCYYAHLHADSVKYAVNGERDGIKFSLISSDFLHFCPKLIEKI